MKVNSRYIIHVPQGMSVSNEGLYYEDRKGNLYRVDRLKHRYMTRLIGKPGRPAKGTSKAPQFPLVLVEKLPEHP